MKKLRKDKHGSLFSIAGASSISLPVLDVDSNPPPLDYEANVLSPCYRRKLYPTLIGAPYSYPNRLAPVLAKQNKRRTY
jgi:hypothetical protein